MNIPLWSWHEPEFSLTEGRVDWGQSAYYNDKNIPRRKEAYAELKVLLGTDQIIWCATKDDYYDHSGRTKVGWVLSVPERDLFRIVNNVAWNQLLGQLDYFPHSLRENWTSESKKITDLYSAEYYSQVRNIISVILIIQHRVRMCSLADG